jgi:hypothetical protein
VEEREKAHPVKKCPSYFSDEKVPQDGGFGVNEAYLASAVVLCAVFAETYVKFTEWDAANDPRAWLFSTSSPQSYW